MTTNDTQSAALASLNINWQSGALRETRRGKVKAVVTGIPGPAFFYSYKHHSATRDAVKNLGITLNRIAKNQWEAVAWINRHTAHLFASLPGVTIPEVPEMAEQPF